MAISSTTAASPRARNRTRNAVDRAPGNPGALPDWATSGGDAIKGHREHQDRMAQIREQRASEFRVPYRHFLQKGDEVDAIILDNDFGPGIYEHDLTMNDRFKRVNPRTGRTIDQFVTSPMMFETDPLTQECGLNPAYVTFLTVGILRPWTKDGVTHNYQRRLVALKGDAMDMMAGIREQQIKAGHEDAPLRGVHIVFRRGNGDQSLRTGLPQFVERHTEQDILDFFGHPEVLGETDGKVIKTKDEDCYPIDYARAFPKPSAEAIRARFNLGGGSHAAGGSGYGRGEFNDGSSGGGNSGGGIRSRSGGNGGGDWDNSGGGASTDGFGNGNSTSGGFGDDLDDDIPF